MASFASIATGVPILTARVIIFVRIAEIAVANLIAVRIANASIVKKKHGNANIVIDATTAVDHAMTVMTVA